MAIPPLLWLAGAAGALWLGLRRLRRYLPSHGAAPEEPGTETVRCAHCGVFLPAELAVERRGRWYCGIEHANRPSMS